MRPPVKLSGPRSGETGGPGDLSGSDATQIIAFPVIRQGLAERIAWRPFWHPQNADRIAREIWEAAPPAPEDHPFLIAKGIKPHGLRLYQGDLIALMEGRDHFNSRRSSLCAIAPDGARKFLVGINLRGLFYRIGELYGAEKYIIAIDFETAATLHEVTGLPAVAVFDADNLNEVSHNLHDYYGGSDGFGEQIIAADNDVSTREKLKEFIFWDFAHIVFPTFADWRNSGRTFSDLYLSEGPKAVRRVIDGGARR